MADLPFTSALVTGASSGIGAAMAVQLADAGIPTVVVARRADRLAALADDHEAIEVLVADLNTAEGLTAVAERIEDDDRPVDLVVNNAGFGTSGPFVDQDPDRMAGEVGLNVGAVTQLSRAALGVMLPRDRGWLLNVASVAGFQPAPGLAVYAATKAYVISLSESLHEEVRGTGVHVTVLCPGLTRTEFQQVSSSDAIADRYPGVLWMSAEQVATAALADAAAGRAMSVPGWTYRALTTASGLSPRGLTRRLSGLTMRGR
jgi:hypothetical protein